MSRVEDFKRYWLKRGFVVKVRPEVHWSGTVEGREHRVTVDNSRVPCLLAMDTCAVHWNGNIVMCAIDCDGKYVAGNIEWNTIQQVWNGPLKWIRQLHICKRFRELPEVCRKCPDWAVKKAQAFFPDESLRKDYEGYIRLGRAFMQPHAAPQDDAGHVTNDSPRTF